jgi:hypothetical protein
VVVSRGQNSVKFPECGERKRAYRLSLLADSGCGRYDAALLGTATIFTNLVALTGTAGVGFGVEK